VVSDILHNSSAPVKNASMYRSALQAALPDVFAALGGVLKAAAARGRMTSQAVRDRVLRVVGFWERVSLFPPLFLSGLESAFLRGVSEEAAKAVEATIDKMEDSQLPPAEEVARQCRQAGLALFQHAGATAPAVLREQLKRLAWLNASVRIKMGLGDPAAAGLGGEGPNKYAGDEEEAQAEQQPSLRSIITANSGAHAAARPTIGWVALAPPEDDDDDDEDMDGVPLPPSAISQLAAKGSSATKAEWGGAPSQPAVAAAGPGDADDDEDVDGVPLSQPAQPPSKTPSGGAPPAVTNADGSRRGRWDDD
jgi:U2-associated protein SR140